ncbi:DUF2834 domain-containing protein [Pseudodonghicola flavimaris]|uniref:DUF2834 domain-containing protein n=1 Tax=Pseudodonghicola flavimaris TaxID=3050036 RepID=A0ABT7EX82_9RHOB|nr:DUF2834 domain-containing protein [Pseudodonghicola flavimaris]MDK3016956.1 DUF2834 domain-containing protein [Pseudodonghicola flavimaris]
MSPLRMIFLALSIWGAVHPMMHIGTWIAANGPNPLGLIAEWFSTPASAAVTWDLVISAIALIVFILAEVAVRRNWIALVAIPATLLIGVSCGLPLYLFLRSRPVV